MEAAGAPHQNFPLGDGRRGARGSARRERARVRLFGFVPSYTHTHTHFHVQERVTQAIEGRGDVGGDYGGGGDVTVHTHAHTHTHTPSGAAGLPGERIGPTSRVPPV